MNSSHYPFDKGRLRAEAAGIGFAAIGVADATEVDPDAHSLYMSWIARGMSGGWGVGLYVCGGDDFAQEHLGANAWHYQLPVDAGESKSGAHGPVPFAQWGGVDACP